jgi:multiple antibiotic resistance protein
MLAQYVSQGLKFFFLFTPFFAVSMFLAMTSERNDHERRNLACRVAVATVVISVLLLFFGRSIFSVFGITIDAFRIGAGLLLFQTAVSLMNPKEIQPAGGEDISVVPLAMPVIVGPASCGALMVEGASLQGVKERIVALAALLTALFAVWIILLSAAFIERKLGQRGISILMRLTALILAALSAQMVMTGICGFL